jgi:hypothetical protein
LGIYWYEYRKSEDGKSVVCSRDIVDYGSRAGGGMQIPVADLYFDGALDFAIGGKSGLFNHPARWQAPRSRARAFPIPMRQRRLGCGL